MPWGTSSTARIYPASPLAAHTRRAVRYPMRLTYQADRIGPDDHTGATVIVTGDAEQITAPGQKARYRVPLRAWPDEAGEHLLRLRPDTVTAYRLTRLPPARPA